MPARNVQLDRLSALSLLEESLHLLRKAPLPVLACYYLGALPLVLAGLFFFAEMSRSPFAAARLGEESLVLAVLLTWMKTWQSVFMQQLLALAQAQEVPSRNFRQVLRLAAALAAVGHWGLGLMAVSLVAVVPFPWTLAFFQNFCALGGSGRTTREALSLSWRQACLWPKQNVVALLLLGLATGVLWINIIQGVRIGPELLKTLLGVDTVFTREGVSVFNTTFISATLGLTYLALGPLVAAFYTLRCFYGNSLRTGEDLRTQLTLAQRSRQAAALPALVLVAMLPLLMASSSAARPEGETPSAHADETSAPHPPGAQTIPPDKLDQSIKKVITRSEYSWRMPRKSAPAAPHVETWLDRLLDRIGNAVHDWLKGSEKEKKDSSSSSWSLLGGLGGIVHVLLWALLVIAVGALLVTLLRFRLGKRGEKNATAQTAAPVLDLNSENVSAADLPEDGWVAMARQYLDRGEYRLALRAMYLAMLAALGESNLLTIARFKSNRDYVIELTRRAHWVPQAVQAFGDNVRSFEEAWYGQHEVGPERIEKFQANQENIRTLAKS